MTSRLTSPNKDARTSRARQTTGPREASRRMRGTRWLLAVAAFLAAPAVHAADWPIIQGTEEGQPKDRPLRPIGFVQVVEDTMLGGYAHGLSKQNAQFDGQRPTF